MRRKRRKQVQGGHGDRQDTRMTVMSTRQTVARRRADKGGRSSSLPLFVSLTIIVLVGLLVYVNSFSGVFLFDGITRIVENPRLSQPLLDFAWLGDRMGRPVVSFSLAVNYALGGLDVWGYHAFNLAVHLVAGLALFGIIRRTLQGQRLGTTYGRAAPWLALTIALIWVVHPLQTQSVTYIIQRCESMMGMFYLLTLYCVIRGAGSSRRGVWYAAAVAACVLGMASKAVMVTAPLMVLLYDRIFLSKSFRESLRLRWGLYLGLALSLAFLANLGPVSRVLKNPGPLAKHSIVFFEDRHLIPPASYAATQPGVILQYLKLSFWPSPLCLDYEWPTAEAVGDVLPQAWMIAVLLAATIWALWRKPALGFVGAWFFFILAPTSSIKPLPDPAFEHRMYLSLAAVVVLVVLAVQWLLRAVSDRPLLSVLSTRLISGGLVILVIASLGYGTVRRNQDYRSHLGMWRNVVEQHPQNPRALCNLSECLRKEDRLAEAHATCAKAIQLRPRFAEAHNTLGLILKDQRRYEEAVEQFSIALRYRPTMVKAHNNMVEPLFALRRIDEAIEHGKKAVRLKPSASAHVNLVESLLAVQRIDEAIEHGIEGVRLDPDAAKAHNNLGLALCRGGRSDEGLGHYREALRLEPDLMQAHFNLGVLMSNQGDYVTAINEYRQVLRLNPRYAEAHYCWGVALAGQGKPDAAATKFRDTLRINPNHARARRHLESITGRRGGSARP